MPDEPSAPAPGSTTRREAGAATPDAPADPDLAAAAEPLSKDAIEAAELRLRRLLDRRDRHNQESRELRAKRDELNTARAAIMDSMQEKRTQRDALNAEVQTWKAHRNEARDKGRALLDAKGKLRSEMATDALGRVRDLDAEVARLEHEYKARPMKVEKEREHVEKIRKTQAEADKLRVVAAEVEKLGVQLKELDSEISKHFTAADDAHAKMMAANEAAQALHAELTPIYEKADVLRGESDRYHREALAAQARANEYHDKAQALRDQVMTVRGDLRRERAEERAELRRVLEEGKAKLQPGDDFYDTVLEQLKKGGKVKL